MSCALDRVSIVIPVAPGETAQDKLRADLKNCGAEILLSSEGSRAKSLNAGAAKARNPFLWFLHADSRVSAANLEALERALKEQPHALHYFDLAYEEGGPATLNACGAHLRSRLLGLPYGDQGLCLAKALFEGYPDAVPYGEDALFVRRAKKAGIKLNRIPSTLQTSARKYREEGWLKLTLLRQWQMIKLLRSRL